MSVNVSPERDRLPHRFNDLGDCECGPRVEWLDPDTEMPYADAPFVVHELRAEPGYRTGWALFRHSDADPVEM